MIFGKKNDDLKDEWFAWRPVQLECGQWAWLERVEREYASHVRFFVTYRIIGE